MLEIVYAMSLGNPRKQVVVDSFEAAQDGALDVGNWLSNEQVQGVYE